MKICCITAVRNEADIIESFVRAHAHLIDHFYFLDDSTDNTQLILLKLSAEGFAIEILRSGMPAYRQDTVTTSAIRTIAELNLFDWFVILDADEFLLCNSRDAFESALALAPSRHCVSMRWSTFVPQSLDYFELKNPIYENFRPRVPEVSDYCKVFVPKHLAMEIRTAVGNHSASYEGGGAVDLFPLPLQLAHLPVRSEAQMILKAIIAVRVLEMKVDRHQGEGFHIINILNLLKENDFKIDLEMLQRIAFEFAISDSTKIPSSIDRTVYVGGPHTELRYPELSKIHVLAALDAQISLLSQRILAVRKAATQINDILSEF